MSVLTIKVNLFYLFKKRMGAIVSLKALLSTVVLIQLLVLNSLE